MGQWKVVVTPPSFFDSPDASAILQAAGCEVLDRRRAKKYSEAEMAELLVGSDAIIASSEPLTARVMDAAPRLRIIARYGVGYDAVDVEAARARGIAVTTVPGTLEETVADFTLGIMLALLRDIPRLVTETRSGKWERPLSTDAWGKALGIVGTGRIGRAVARRAAAFGMTLLGYDPYPDPAWAAATGLRYTDLPELLASADVVTLHAPATPATHELINARTLAVMKPGAFLVNAARGSLVHEPALYDALTNGRLAGAALDVFAKEPPGADHPLLALPNVLPFPHVASATVEAARRMGVAAAREVVRVLRGEPPLHLVPELRESRPV